ncbi:MAG: molybdopterin molybdotransferase MoeA [Gemmatimonadetes bacterium]|nr:molybdopterin molybdotransferase MoeA [Gemmatimonadota bacterium]
MLTPSQAATSILESVKVIGGEEIALSDADGRVLSADIESPIDLPGWDNSAMDGYAVLAEYVRTASTTPIELSVVETIPAGTFPSREPGPGECSRIFTGAPMPLNTDSVIRQEDTVSISDTVVRVTDVRDLGRNVRARGEDITAGSIVLTRGTILGAAHLGILASIARSTVPIFRQPVVAIIATGDEIADLDERDAILDGKKIASSNTYSLISMVHSAGGVSLNLGIAKDDPADLRSKLEDACAADIIITSAGVSVGEHDHVRSTLDAMGFEEKFWRIKMRPGAPVGHGILRGTPWIGLPGNPVSTMVTFELFARPAIRRMLDQRLLFRRCIEVEVASHIKHRPKLQHFLRVVLDRSSHPPKATPTGPQGSGILTSMARADALLVVPAEKNEVAPGDFLKAIVLDDPVHVAEPPF